MMLRPDRQLWARRARLRATGWWRGGSTRLRLRRRLVVFSIPVALVLLVLIGKLISVQLVGSDAADDFASHDTEALRNDISALAKLNIIEPQKVTFAQGDLAVLEGRLEDADHAFSVTVAHSPGGASCPARVNLELVRETLGDLSARSGNKSVARQRYISSLDVVTAAPAHCFTDNNDPNSDRRRIRHATPGRLKDKLKSLDRPPAKPAPPASPNPTDPSAPLTSTQLPPPPQAGPPTPEAPTPPPPPPSGNGPNPVFGPGASGGNGGNGPLNDADPDRLPSQGGGPKPGHELGRGGDPLDKLRDALGTSDSTGASRE